MDNKDTFSKYLITTEQNPDKTKGFVLIKAGEELQRGDLLQLVWDENGLQHVAVKSQFPRNLQVKEKSKFRQFIEKVLNLNKIRTIVGNIKIVDDSTKV